MRKKKLKLFEGYLVCKHLLPEDSFLLMELYLEQDKSQNEIAVILKLSPAIIRSKINQAAFLIDKFSNAPEYIKALKVQNKH